MSKRDPLEKMLKQKRIDISNLRFYANEAELHKWDTGTIGPDVITHTLRDIANRLAYEVAALEIGDGK